MRFISADIIFPINVPPISNGIVVVDHSGKILDLLDPVKNDISDSLPIERFDGILCPGFVNTHCHLELSHLKGKFSQRKGLPEFIEEMVGKRNEDNEIVLQAMRDADNEMYDGGIVAVGDISNNSLSSAIKKQSNIYYHTFVELFDIFPDKADECFSKGKILQEEFLQSELSSSIVPHSNYTVTKKLIELICDYAIKSGSIICIHNQESSAENEMFQKGTGSLIEKLQKLTGAFSNWKSFGKSSLVVLVDEIHAKNAVQFVHNTFTNSDDIRLAMKKFSNSYWCFCVNANLFIENRLPDIPKFIEENCMITIGTDSYASNNSLSIIDEMKTINRSYPGISLDEKLKWATFNGANYLGISEKLGTFEKGKSPGVNYISNIDLEKLSLKNDSKVKKLM